MRNDLVTDVGETLVTGCHFKGNPPKGFSSWLRYFEYCFTNDILFDLNVEAINPNVDGCLID